MKRLPDVFLLHAVMLVVPLCLTLTSCSQSGAGGDAGGKNEAKPVDVKIAEVSRRDISRSVDVVGSLLPFEEVTVSSEVDGRVEKIDADIGDSVRQGQTLVEVAPEELQYALDGKVAQLHQALAKLGMTDENSPLPPNDQVPDVQKAAADRNVANQDYQRAKDLYNQSLIPKQQLDEAESKAISARASYQTTLQQVQITKASIEEVKADVDLARKKIRDTQIKAPFTGWIKQRLVAPGQYLKVQAPVYTMVDVHSLRFQAEIPDRITPWVKVGDAVVLHIEAYQDRTFDGKISRIGPSASQDSRTFTVEALIDNEAGLLKPGFFAKATLSTEKHDSILTVPADAVTFAYGVYKIFAIKGNEISMKDVRLGDHFGDDVELIEGAKEHERVAISNLAFLKDGTKVSVVESKGDGNGGESAGAGAVSGKPNGGGDKGA